MVNARKYHACTCYVLYFAGNVPVCVRMFVCLCVCIPIVEFSQALA